MTDARFPERWLNDRHILRLSDPAFRTFVLANAWSVSNRTDGHLDAADLQLIPGAKVDHVAELLTAHLWAECTCGCRGWRIVDFEVTQTTRAQLAGLEHKRAIDRERKARQRAHDHGDHRACLPEHCPHTGNVTRDGTRDVTRDTEDRPGQARTGTNTGPETREQKEPERPSRATRPRSAPRPPVEW